MSRRGDKAPVAKKPLVVAIDFKKMTVLEIMEAANSNLCYDVSTLAKKFELTKTVTNLQLESDRRNNVVVFLKDETYEAVSLYQIELTQRCNDNGMNISAAYVVNRYKFLSFLQGELKVAPRDQYEHLLGDLDGKAIILSGDSKDSIRYQIAEALAKRLPNSFVPFDNRAWSPMLDDKAVFSAMSQHLGIGKVLTQTVADLSQQGDLVDPNIFAGSERVIIKPLSYDGGYGCFTVPTKDINIYLRLIQYLKEVYQDQLEGDLESEFEDSFLEWAINDFIKKNSPFTLDDATRNVLIETLNKIVHPIKSDETRYWLIQNYVKHTQKYNKHLTPSLTGKYESKGRAVFTYDLHTETCALVDIYFMASALPITSTATPADAMRLTTISGNSVSYNRQAQKFSQSKHAENYFNLCLKEQLEAVMTFACRVQDTAELARTLVNSEHVTEPFKAYLREHFAPYLGADAGEEAAQGEQKKQTALFSDLQPNQPARAEDVVVAAYTSNSN